MRTKNTNLKDVWRTPQTIIDMIGPIELDPCAGKEYSANVWYDENDELHVDYDGDQYYQPPTSIGSEENLTKNGLQQDWYDRVFVNMPFSMKKEFLSHAVRQYKNGNVDYIILTPDSTDTKSWWHQYIAEFATYIWFSRGRINYISPVGHEPDPKESADTDNVTFGTALSIFGNPPKDILRTLNANGQLVQSYQIGNSSVSN